MFVSYTARDLGDHAAAVLAAVHQREWVGVHFQEWAPVDGHKVKTCLEKVRSCDLLIVLVAHRYGWVPDPEGPEVGERERADGRRSMVWLEVAEARRTKKLVQVFLVRETHPWDPTLMEDGEAKARLGEFRNQLDKRWVQFFTTPEDLRGRVERVLEDAKPKLLGPRATPPARSRTPRDPLEAYLAKVREACGGIDLLGFGHDRNVRLPIEKVYVQLSLVARAPEHALHGEDPRQAEPDIPLPEVLGKIAKFAEPAAVLLGVPGCGKSTGLRRLAWECAQPERRKKLAVREGTLPVLLRLRSLQGGVLPNDWPAFVADECKKWLELEVDVERLLRSPILWLLDGLDEIADPTFRSEFLAWLRGHLASRWELGDRLLVSSRPEGWAPEDPVRGAYLEWKVRLLDATERARFVELWHLEVASSLREDRQRALEQARELQGLLDERDRSDALFSEIVGNPLLLTILCFLHRDGVELPRRRAALYDRCLTVLLSQWRKGLNRSRGQAALDEAAAREVLKPLAWWLHAEQQSPAAPIGVWVQRATAALASLTPGAKLGREGRAFLKRIRKDSGLVQEASAEQWAFLHYTFQEYLAGCFAIDEDKVDQLVENFGTKRWQELTLLTLSDAPRSFARRFFERLLAGEAWFEQGKHFQDCLAESMHVPIEPFVEALRAQHGAKRRALFGTVANRDDRPLLELAEEWKADPDPETRAAAEEILDRAPASYRVRPDPVRIDIRVPEPGMVLVVERAGISLVRIPPGEFDMGSTKGHADERPVRRVSIEKGFWIAKHPVTNEQYARYLDETKGKPPEFWSDRDYNRPSQPVVGVSWDDARAYCRWAGLVLPSEAWWEYACRGSTKPTRTAYWSGDAESDLGDVGWYEGNSDGKLQPVAQKKPNAFGLFDVHGNVWEWCEDSWHGSYSGAPKGEQAWVDKASEHRVIRGGSFGSSAVLARSSYRNGGRRSVRWHNLGFRPAQAVTP